MACRQLASWTRRPVKKRSRPTKSASGRSRTSVAKAASISPLVLASRTWTCSPIARAAVSTSSHGRLGIAAGLAGLTSTATRVAAGHQLAQQLQPLCRQLAS